VRQGYYHQTLYPETHLADLLALLLASLSTLLQPGVTEQQLEAQLAAAVKASQPAPLKDVKVDASGVSSIQVDKLEFRFTEIAMDQLQVERATFTVTGIQRNKAGRLSLKSIGWSAAIADGALTRALRAEGGKLKDAQVTIVPGGLTLNGKWPLGITKVKYGVTGNLSVDGTLLNFHIDKSDISGVGMTKGINDMIEGEVNPVYDFERFAARSAKEIKLAREQLAYDFKLRVDKLEPRAGHIIVHGSA
jgi:hypothetical protein